MAINLANFVIFTPRARCSVLLKMHDATIDPSTILHDKIEEASGNSKVEASYLGVGSCADAPKKGPSSSEKNDVVYYADELGP